MMGAPYIKISEAFDTAQVDPDRLAGSYRLDVFCRCLASTLGPRPRKDSIFLAAFTKPSWTPRLGVGLLESLDGQPPAGAAPVGAVEVVGREAQDQFLEERQTALRLQQMLNQQPVPGWRSWEEASMRSLIVNLLKSHKLRGQRGRLFVLQEERERDLGVCQLWRLFNLKPQVLVLLPKKRV
eukprot:g29752.t1